MLDFSNFYPEGWIGGFAAIIGLVDMYFNDCQTECLARSEAEPRWHYQIGVTEFRDEFVGQEILLGYDFPKKYGPFQLTAAASITDTQDAWAGAGLKWTSEHLLDSPWFIEGYSMPGLFAQGDGPDLGGFIQFRGSLGVGYRFDSGVRAILAYDHRSNGHIWEVNPGIETLNFSISVPVE